MRLKSRRGSSHAYRPTDATPPPAGSPSRPRTYGSGGIASFSTVALLSLTLRSHPAAAFEPELDDAFGLEATRAFETRAGGALEASYVDALVETGNTDSEELDQRYSAGMRFDAAYSPAPVVSIRAFARASYVDALRQDSLVADRRVGERHARFNGALDGSFAAAQGVEVFLGSAVAHLPKSVKTISLPSVESRTRYGAVTFFAPRVGLLKRADVFAAGLYYGLMGEKERDYARVTGLDIEEGEEWVTIPSVLGGMARFTFGKDLELEADLALVQLGESEEKTEQGAPLYRDYYRVRLGGLLPLGTVGAYAALTHRTLAYDDQGFMTMETIPTTRLELRCTTLGQGARAWAGLAFTYGSDSQSIPELNAEFTLRAYALNLGAVVPM